MLSDRTPEGAATAKALELRSATDLARVGGAADTAMTEGTDGTGGDIDGVCAPATDSLEVAVDGITASAGDAATDARPPWRETACNSDCKCVAVVHGTLQHEKRSNGRMLKRSRTLT